MSTHDSAPVSTDPHVTAAAAGNPAATAAMGPGEVVVELSIWQHPFVQNVLPFLTSLLLHATIIVVGLLTLRVYQTVVNNPNREQIIIPDAAIVTDGTPGGIPHPGLGGDPTKDAAQALDPDVPKESRGLTEKRGLTALPQMLGGGGDAEAAIGVPIGQGPGSLLGKGEALGPGGGGGGDLAPFGAPGGGGGIGIKSRFIGSGGNARRVVFVCDASGSMLTIFDNLKSQISLSVSQLAPIQAFNIVFFREQTFLAVDKNNLLMAIADNKRKAYEFLETMSPRASSNPLPAIEFALRLKPDLIYLLTDGDFGGLTGEVTNDDVVRFCKQRTADGKTKINTIAYLPEQSATAQEKEFVKALQAIARDSGGIFRFVNDDDLRAK
jgi:hypothetical protein